MPPPTARASLDRPAPLRLSGEVLVTCAIACLWLFSIVPALLSLLANGRGSIYNGITPTVFYGPSAGVGTAFCALAIAVCLYAMVANRYRLTERRSIYLILLLSVWFLTFTPTVSTWRDLLDAKSAFVPISILATWFISPSPMAVLRAMRVATLATATLSIVLGLLTDLARISGNQYFEVKELLPIGVLAGTFSHPNSLGLALSLGVPSILAASVARRRKALEVGLVAFAIVWSSSRSATFAALAVLLVYIWTATIDRRTILIQRVIGAVAISTMVALPLLTTNPEAFTGRGLIWQTTLETVHSYLGGLGPEAFQFGSPIVAQLGYASSHGHNLFITNLAYGGLVAGALSALMLWVGTLQETRGSTFAPTFALPMLGLVLNSILEGRVDLVHISDISFAAWPLLILPLCGARSLSQ